MIWATLALGFGLVQVGMVGVACILAPLPGGAWWSAWLRALKCLLRIDGFGTGAIASCQHFGLPPPFLVPTLPGLLAECVPY